MAFEKSSHYLLTDMPRPNSLHLPLSSGDHLHPHDNHYSKSHKAKKPHHPFFTPTTAIVSGLCLLIGVAGAVFFLVAVFRPRPSLFNRCGRIEDTFRAFYSLLPSSQRLGAAHGADTGKTADRPKLLGFVGVQTGFSSFHRRRALRSTWFPSHPEDLLSLEQATGLAFRFVIGQSKAAGKMAELEEEILKYKDFMIIDIEEGYSELPHKTLAYFKAAFQLFEADYYVKVDDDVYLRPDRLATLLAKDRSHPYTYIGCMKKGPVITDPKMKWYEKSGHLLGNEYFLHAYGPIYVLSAEVVASLSIAPKNSFRMFNNEDVTIGAWMLAFNVYHEDNRAICDPRCTPTSIAVWDIPKCSGLCSPVTRMKELHNISMCSQSPTLPPDDR